MTPSQRNTLANLGVAVAYAGSGAVGLWLGGMVQGNVTLLWPPAGVALACACLYGMRIWPGLALGAFAATASTAAPLSFALWTAVTNPLPAIATGWIVRRFHGGKAPELDQVGMATLLLGLGALVTPALGALLGTWGLWVHHMVDATNGFGAWASWYVGDAVGAASIAPLLILLLQRRYVTCPWRERFVEMSVFGLLLAGLGYWMVTHDLANSPMFVFAFVLTVWAALRFGVFATVMLSVVINASVIASTLSQSAMLLPTALLLGTLGLTLEMLTVSLTGLILSIAVSERDHAQRAQAATIESLRQDADALAQTKEALAQAHQDLRRFAEVTAHHLQEPARRLGSYAARLQSRLDGKIADPEVDISLRFIVEQSTRLQALLRDVERYLAAGMPRGAVGRCEVAPVLSRVLQRMANAIAAAGAAVHTVGALPPVWIDAPRLADLFEVLLDNALLHAGSVHDPVRATLRVTIEGVLVQDGMARYHVSDNSHGIEAQYRERVFTPFERLCAHSSSTGIGLAIVRRIAENCGGRSWIEESPGGGCRVVFELPAQSIP